MEALHLDPALPDALLPWYYRAGRALPWRADREPYHVWLSEIMLQQTRVEAVRGYYTRFLETLPDIASLASCEDALLHKLWEGLGYYNRVRNLKKAAQVILDTYGGQFPREYAQIRALPGIGDYTAGAVCSICFNAPTPAVDGNVLRVVSRLTENSTPIDLPAMKAAVRDALLEIYPPQAGDFTQALMELGATLCGPNREPNCQECPCFPYCRSAQTGTAVSLPVKTPKKARRHEDMTVFILSCDGKYALEQRPEQGLLAGLWQFPNHPGKLEPADALLLLENQGLHPREILRQAERKHIFTHIQWNMRGIYAQIATPIARYTWFSEEDLRRTVALPTAFRQFWDTPSDPDAETV